MDRWRNNTLNTLPSLFLACLVVLWNSNRGDGLIQLWDSTLSLVFMLSVSNLALSYNYRNPWPTCHTLMFSDHSLRITSCINYWLEVEDHQLKRHRSQILIHKKKCHQIRKRKMHQNHLPVICKCCGQIWEFKSPGKFAHHLSSALNTGFKKKKKRPGMFYDVRRTSVIDKYVFRRLLAKMHRNG